MSWKQTCSSRLLQTHRPLFFTVSSRHDWGLPSETSVYANVHVSAESRRAVARSQWKERESEWAEFARWCFAWQLGTAPCFCLLLTPLTWHSPWCLRRTHTHTYCFMHLHTGRSSEEICLSPAKTNSPAIYHDLIRKMRACDVKKKDVTAKWMWRRPPRVKPEISSKRFKGSCSWRSISMMRWVYFLTYNINTV